MAFSAGFHPHPKISYANAVATGVASEAEYVEIGLAERRDPDAVRAALDAALPDGLDILTVVEAGPHLPGALADRLESSDWEIVLPGVDTASAQAAVDAFLAREDAPVTRMMKTGPRTFDTRGAVVRVRVLASDDGICAILRVVVRHATPAVRPDDILTALRDIAGLELGVPPRVTRLAQGPLLLTTGDAEGARVTDPLVADQGVDAVSPHR